MKMLLSASVAAVLVALLPAVPAKALLKQTFVASYGSDSSDCSNATPCRLLSAAHSKTESAGQITCVDGGSASDSFGNVSIDRSIIIDCAAVASKITINAPGHVVVLRNLTINGILGVQGPGIEFLAARTLVIENCTIVHWAFSVNPSRNIGLAFFPAVAGSHLIVNDSTFINNGIGSSGGGIVILPFGGGTAQVALNRVTIGNGIFGISVNGSQSTGGINVTISDSVLSGNSQDGIIATTPAGGAPIGVMVKNTKSVNNAGFGIRSVGPNVTIRVDGSTVTGNSTGLSFNFFGTGGALLTAGNNMVQGNGANGSFSGTAGLQ